MTADSPSRRTEPAADMRVMASAVWQVYVALTGEGFTEAQAVTIVGQMLIAAQQGRAS